MDLAPTDQAKRVASRRPVESRKLAHSDSLLDINPSMGRTIV